MIRITLASSLVIAPVLASGAAWAHPVKTMRAERPLDDEFSAGDWTASFFVGNVGGALGGFLGGALGYAAAGECVEDDSDESLFGDCFLHGIGEAFIGGAVGSTFGGAAGIYGYGEASGHSGSYWAAAGGWTVGLAGALGVGALASEGGGEASSAVMWMALFTLPAIGGTAGYVLSLDSAEDEFRPSGGLVDVDRGEVRLGVPEIGVTLDAAGDLERVDMRLVGGRF